MPVLYTLIWTSVSIPHNTSELTPYARVAGPYRVIIHLITIYNLSLQWSKDPEPVARWDLLIDCGNCLPGVLFCTSIDTPPKFFRIALLDISEGKGREESRF